MRVFLQGVAAICFAILTQVISVVLRISPDGQMVGVLAMIFYLFLDTRQPLRTQKETGK